MDNFFSIISQTEYIEEIKKSKFAVNFKMAENCEAAEKFIEEIKEKYSDATHNCYAYIVDENQNISRFSDDGEPSGTAGQPILQALKSRKLFNIVCVVTRYFGGIKLGAGGLVRAYKNCVIKAIDCAEITQFIKCAVMQFDVDYDRQNFVENILKNYNCRISKEFFEKVKFEIAVEKTQLEIMKNELCMNFTCKNDTYMSRRIKNDKN